MVSEKRSPKIRRMEGIALVKRRAARTEIQRLASSMVIYLLMTLTDVYKWMDQTETISEEDSVRQGKHVIGP
ncbi:hypothetical protein GJ744_004636 [Endocarpon pusillum]|uniref:Uncharacterized protein n=1 Tax=Endocarpon pusillum TaxID=364733 RepID=A0A8H7AR46_9EURO|nr:hypothetical protein GJ744_004636 [Endocarpon pusillum]